MNTLTFRNGFTKYTLNGKQLDTNLKPFLSFEFDELYFTETQKFCTLNNKRYILNKNKINEIITFLKNIESEKDSLMQRQKYTNTIQIMQQYLNSTDWLIIREIETGKKVPPGVKEERTKARNKISTLEGELK